MERLTTDRDYLVDKEAYERHLAQGYPRSTPQERFLKLCEYERTGHTPEEIAEFDKLYYDKCQEVNRLNAELAELKKQPQGDLISRSALIEHLLQYDSICGIPLTEHDKKIINGVIGHIGSIEPTAYDVDAVVEQLMIIYKEGYCPNEDSLECVLDKTCSDCYREKFTDIVRAGGKE